MAIPLRVVPGLSTNRGVSSTCRLLPLSPFLLILLLVKIQLSFNSLAVQLREADPECIESHIFVKRRHVKTEPSAHMRR